MAQCYSCTMSYNGEFGTGRNHFLLTDFRIKSKPIYLNQRNTFSGDTLLQMTNRFMDKVNTPFIGFRLKAKYVRLISRNPANQGRLFRDPNGRPSGAVLSALYLGHGHPDYYYGK